ncbi:hydroxymethylbilane synthase [Alkalitalea saponilacus]|uniref:Porphobilinogen deaminase n=1 Tax=Alkalitalea saponilacus TaxID=889453 RepID=A0A1T5HSF7_9BACT|nr:hydroxymethylbilane synthase [Alkalitalea saponilacus]ASB47698.1 hydroxymethylbilane synthase [Alkalitalea saponilacus]SKC23623.1 hydroxymethylbilane synthase [Alkalitalea saponilacus]
MNRTIKIGTRGSQLALWQAHEVQKQLQSAFPDIQTEIVVIKTKGDIILDVALSKIGDKGLFTKEIEQALLNGDIDLAVHSLKDMPTELPDNLILGGVLERGEVRDVFLSRDKRPLSTFTSKDKIATSSLRRQAQLLHYNPALNIVDIRGNVNSRIQKMSDGYCDALIMAGAGIQRLGLEHLITQYLEPETVMPAVSQGAVTIEIREGDEEIYPIIDAINHLPTWYQVMAERAFLRTMEGGCQVPVACFSEVADGNMKMRAMVASLDGRIIVKDVMETTLDEATEKAIEMAFSMLDAGAEKILESIRGND